MKPMRISQNIVSVSEFKAKAAELLRAMKEDDAPTVITQNGRPAAVMLSPATYDELTEHHRFVTAVNEGLADGAAGRTTPHDQVMEEMEARFGPDE